MSTRLGHHQLCIESDQPHQVKRHGLQESRKLILGDAPITHPLWTLRKDPLIRRSQMRIPPIAIPILRLHVLALNGREMTAVLDSSLPCGGGTISFIP
jgi:hypothetical protein